MLFVVQNKWKLSSLAALVGLSAVALAQQAGIDNSAIDAAALPPVDCVVSPNKVIDLASAVPGVIESLAAERSDFVDQNQVVAMLDADVEKASVQLAQKRAEIEAEVYLEQINLDFAQRQQKRIDVLYDTDAVSYQNKDDADREVETSTWKLRQAKDLVDVRKLELNRAYQQLEQKTVRSPISGFVVQTYKSEGEYVEDQPVVRIAQLDPLNVEAIVPMEMFGDVAVGMTAKVRLETLTIPTQEATVTIVDRMGDAASGTFGVRLSLPNPDNQIPAGLKCDLNFMPEMEVVEAELEPEQEQQKEQSNAIEVAADQSQKQSQELLQEPSLKQQEKIAATDRKREAPAPVLAINDGGASHVGRASASKLSLR